MSERIDPAIAEMYFGHVAASDRRGAARVALDALHQGASVEDVLADLVGASQLEVGRLWERNTWNVAREHAATSVNEHVVAAIAAQNDADPLRGTIVVTCVEGEWHSLPARVLSEVLRLAGYDVTYLGASTPASHLGAFLHDYELDAVALSCSVPTSLPHARRMIEAARDAGVPVIVGGRGFGSDGRWARRLGATAWAPDARDAVRLLTGPDWPVVTSPAEPMNHPDSGHADLAHRHGAVVEAAMARLAERFPPMASYDGTQRARTREDFGYIVDFLTASLYVDDATLFTEFTLWLRDILVARSVPAGAVSLSLDVLADVVEGADLASEGKTRARDFVELGRSALTDISSEQSARPA